MSSILEKFDAKRIRLTKELRRAVMMGDGYQQFKLLLDTLEELRETANEMLAEHKDAIATFNQRGGTFTRKESGALEFRLNKTSITLTVDEDNHIQDVAFAAHVRDRESYEIILRMIKALQDRPLIEEVLDNITETRDRLEMQQSLSGFAELRRMIRNDTGLAIMTISGMDEAEEDE